ncbi:hypothetical protein CR513_46555, partial [Mucuna pruriens]
MTYEAQPAKICGVERRDKKLNMGVRKQDEIVVFATLRKTPKIQGTVKPHGSLVYVAPQNCPGSDLYRSKSLLGLKPQDCAETTKRVVSRPSQPKPQVWTKTTKEVSRPSETPDWTETTRDRVARVSRRIPTLALKSGLKGRGLGLQPNGHN